MAWNPSQKVADCRAIARKWGGKKQVIIITLDNKGHYEMATYGETKDLCECASVLGDAAIKGITRRLELVGKLAVAIAKENG